MVPPIGSSAADGGSDADRAATGGHSESSPLKRAKSKRTLLIEERAAARVAKIKQRLSAAEIKYKQASERPSLVKADLKTRATGTAASTATSSTATTTTTSKRSKGKGPMKSPRPARRAAPSASKVGGAAAKRAERVDKGAGAAVAKNTAALKRTAFRSLAMEIQLTHSDEATAHVAWAEAVPGDGGMLGPLDFASFVSRKYPLLDNRSMLAIAFQQTVEMQTKTSPLLSGKFRIGARFFAPLLLHAVYLAEAFAILGVKGWSDFAPAVKKLGPGRLMLKLGKGQDAKRPMPDADAVALLGLDELAAAADAGAGAGAGAGVSAGAGSGGLPHAVVIAACKWFADEATPDDWKWVAIAKHSNAANPGGGPAVPASASAAAGPDKREASPLPRRASAPIVAQTVLGDASSELAVAITGAGDELDVLWESFSHPASTKAKGQSLSRLAELINEKGGMMAASSAIKYAYNMATGMQPSAKAILEQPAFQYATFSAMVLTDLATILGTASAKVYNADPIISLAEFKEGIAGYRVLQGEALEAACTTLDTTQTGVFPYSAACKWYVKHRRQQWPNIAVPILPVLRSKSGAREPKQPAAKTPAARRKVAKSPAPKKPAGGRTSPARAPVRKSSRPGAVPKSNRKPSKQVLALTSVTKRKKVLITTLTPSANTGIHALKETRDEDVAAAEVIQFVLNDPSQVLRLWGDIDNKVDGTATAMDIANSIIRSYGVLKGRLGPHINSFFESLVKAGKGTHPGFVDDPTSIPCTVIEMLHYARLAQCFDLPPPSANIDARIDAKIAHDSIAKLGAHKFLGAKEKAAFHSMPSKEGGERGTVLLSDFCHWYAEERVRREPKLDAAKQSILAEFSARGSARGKGKPKRRFSLFKAKAKEVKEVLKAEKGFRAFGGPNAGKEIDGRLNFKANAAKIAI